MGMIAVFVGWRAAVIVGMIRVAGAIMAVVVRRSVNRLVPGIEGAVGMTARPMRRVEACVRIEGIDNGKTQDGDHCAAQCHPRSVSPRTSGHAFHFPSHGQLVHTASVAASRRWITLFGAAG